jgi:outer membrane protein TolC
MQFIAMQRCNDASRDFSRRKEKAVGVRSQCHPFLSICGPGLAGFAFLLVYLAPLFAVEPAPGPRALILAPIPVPDESPTATPSSAPLATKGELSLETLVPQVLARNPSLAQMAAAWEAAVARYPQAISLEDPMVAVTLGPGTYGSNTVEGAYRIEIAQKYPFPGKRRLRGENALAEARAAGNEVDDLRLQLIEAASSAFYDYYLVARALEVNAEGLRLLRSFHDNASARFQTGLVPQQDVVQADVEIGRQQERTRSLERMQRIAIARINTLLDVPPDSPLPPPPRELAEQKLLPDAAELRARALSARPDLQALANRIAAEQAALALAHKEYCPDFEPFAMYDRFMGNTSDTRALAYMVGLKVNLPVRVGRRDAAVAEAVAKVNQRRAELARLTDQVNFQVQEAFEQVRESTDIILLYARKILPDARLNVDAAQSAYVTGKIPMLSLIEAQRNIVLLRDRYFEALADYHRRLATLERVVGEPVAERSVAAPQNGRRNP